MMDTVSASSKKRRMEGFIFCMMSRPAMYPECMSGNRKAICFLLSAVQKA